MLSVLAALAPTLAGALFGSKGKDVAETAVSVAKAITGKADDNAALAALQANPEQLVQWQEAMNSYAVSIQQELTKRHEADMKSDSWLSKNVRPMCLLGITLAITVGTYLPDTHISAAKFKAITDLGTYIYGYYFIGRSGEKSVDFGAIAGVLGRKA